MNAKLKKTIETVVPPRLLAPIKADRWWRFLWKISEQNGMHELCHKMESLHGLTIRQGPFAGMQLSLESLLAGGNTAALLGTYEMELHPWLTALRPNLYQRLIDIGSAEGFYAVGMATRTGSCVDAFDPSLKARRLCRSMAKMNEVSHLVRIRSWCSERTLLQLEGVRAFVISDCEGFEAYLFTEAAVRALSASDLIIELHDHNRPPGSTRRILEERFAGTHHTEIVPFRPRKLVDFPIPALAEQLGASALRAIKEGRGDHQEWLVATARSNPQAKPAVEVAMRSENAREPRE